MDDDQSKRDKSNIPNIPITNTTHELPSKLKMKNKLSPFAPAFDVSHSPTINPYSGQYGISTLPAQVPPAQMTIKDNQPSTHSHVHVHQATYTTNDDINIDINHNNGNRVTSNKHQTDDELYHQPFAYHSSDHHQQSPTSSQKPSHTYMVRRPPTVQYYPSSTEHYYDEHTSPPGYGSQQQRIIHRPHANGHQNGHRIRHRNTNQVMYHRTSAMTNGKSSTNKISIKTYTKHRNAQPIGTTVAYKHPARNFGQPSANETDPKFTNPAEIASYQRWELLESAQRWLPGEGTFITWKKHRYLIGPPIHMGMNGHIHYCYKYPIPTQALNKMNGDGENNEEIDDVSDEMREQPIVETLAAKIVPNTPAFAREIVILRALQKCENVTELYDVLESERTLISILELAQADVYNFFVGRGSIRHGWNLEKPAIREHFSKMVIKNVVQGLSQMHTNEYLHCDLKSLNILLYIYMTDHSNARGGVYIKAKLTDFGHSSHGRTRISEQLFNNGMARVGTAGHVAPELFVEGTKCTGMIDIWSLGIVMFSMLVPGRLLFGEYTDLPTLKRTYDRLNTMNPWGRDGRDRPSWWTDFERLSPEARDLILWMTRYDPKERPSCVQILEHPWFILGQSNYRENYRPKLEWVDRLCQSTIAQE